MSWAVLVRELANATRMYLEVIRTIAPELAGIPECEGLYDELGVALRADEQGTPARVAVAVADALADVRHELNGGRS